MFILLEIILVDRNNATVTVKVILSIFSMSGQGHTQSHSKVTR